MAHVKILTSTKTEEQREESITFASTNQNTEDIGVNH